MSERNCVEQCDMFCYMGRRQAYIREKNIYIAIGWRVGDEEKSQATYICRCIQSNKIMITTIMNGKRNTILLNIPMFRCKVKNDYNDCYLTTMEMTECVIEKEINLNSSLQNVNQPRNLYQAMDSIFTAPSRHCLT